MIGSDDLRDRIKSSGVRDIWIDTEKGLDIPGDEDTSTGQAPVNSEESSGTNIDQPHQSTQTSTSVELEYAAKLIAKSKKAVTAMFNEARMGRFASLEQADALVNEISSSVIRNTQALVSLSRLKQADEYTYMHSVAVCAMMIALARELGMSDDEAHLCGKAGLLHDVGKMAVDPDVLNKPGSLTDQEYLGIQRHPQLGHEMLVATGNIPTEVLDVCLHHHEKFDGRGYPSQLNGEDISVYSRMAAVCDVYDAITSNRPYKSGWCPSESLKRMAEWTQNGHFDPVIFAAFVKCVGIYPVGTLLKLKSGHLALVIDISKSLLRPIVKTIFSTKSMTYVQPQLIDLSLLADTDFIVSREDASNWGLKDIDKYWSQN